MTEPKIPQGGLEGMSALVTGGGSGIGLGCAARLARDGAYVTICGRTEEKLQAGAAEIEATAAAGASVTTVACDVTDEEQVRAAVEKAAERTGRLDAVVASAGGTEWMGPINQAPLDAWQRVLSLNIDGTFLTLKYASRLMVKQGGGSFVGVSSIAGGRTHRWFGAYGVGKAGIEATCLLAADELGASGVRVNVVRPGLVRTGLTGLLTEGGPVTEDYLAQMPVSRVGHVDDVAGLCRYLVGPESTWLTGQVIGIDGGHSLRRGPDFTAYMEPTWGADALRGVVKDDE
ncbi:MAG: SDR family oxidoreductase [Myxococcales bacterium]|nr:SDR family oxidoreductase [Myxococcales bacterium]